jgi:hypothetical protein
MALDYDKVASLETHRAYYGSFTVVRFINAHGAITWLKLRDGKLYNLPSWLKPAKLEADYQDCLRQ